MAGHERCLVRLFPIRRNSLAICSLNIILLTRNSPERWCRKEKQTALVHLLTAKSFKNLFGGREKRGDVCLSGEGALHGLLHIDWAGQEEGPREG